MPGCARLTVSTYLTRWSTDSFSEYPGVPAAPPSPLSLPPLITLLMAQVFLPGLEPVTKQVVAGTSLTVAGVVLVIVGSTM